MIKRLLWLLLAAIVLKASGLLPFQSSDVAQLVPVQALVVSMEADSVVLRGEACMGVGKTWDDAWQDLQNSAEGHVFLGTAEHLVLCGEGITLLPQILQSEVLRPAAQVCVCSGEAPEPQKAAAYLGAHPSSVTLRQVLALQLRQGKVELPRLMQTQGGLRIEQNG